MSQEIEKKGRKNKSLIIVSIIIGLLGATQIMVIIHKNNPDFFRKTHTSITKFTNSNKKILNNKQEIIIDQKNTKIEEIDLKTREVVYFEEGDIFESKDYFTSERDRLIEEEKSFVDANLSERIITVYKEGEIDYTLPIKAIASKTSWWQTPPGVYQARNKIETHKSSFGNVFMPWNIPFQGNFFIHGWPYYPSGRPATSSVSGGCIRLSEEDAKTLFFDIPIGTPIIVHTNEFETNFTNKKDGINFPKLSTENYFVANLDTNEVYGEGNNLKEMTLGNLALLPLTLSAAEYIGIERNHFVLATEEYKETTGLTYADDSNRINTGDRLRTYDLLFPALEDWSFESLHIFGKYLSEERYIDVTNEKLSSIGISNSHINNLIKRDPKNYSSPKDLFLITKYAHMYRAFLLDISSAKISTYLYGEPWLGDRRENPRIFPGFSNFEGGFYDKYEGHTIANFSYTIDNEEQTVFIGVFGASDPLEDIAQIEIFLRELFD